MITGGTKLHGSAISDLPLFRRSLVPAAGTAPLDRLLAVLSDGRWHTARELKIHGFSDRELRELVESSDGRVLSFPGSPGYKAFEQATVDEIGQAKALLNQGRAMIRRFLRYKRRFHRGK